MKSKIFHGEHNIDIEYVFHKVAGDSDTLIVSFPGAGGFQPGCVVGWDAYGYLITLRSMYVNGLFIKVNSEYAKSRMTFRNHEPVIEDAVMALVQKCKEECKAKRIIVIGSSMGGYCALYYGLKHDWDIVSGSPSSWYSSDVSVAYAAGKVSEEERLWLNGLLPAIMNEAGKRGYNKRCFISFGEGEPDWVAENHGKKLVEDLKKAGIPHECKLYPFSEHGSIHHLFPKILTWKLKSYLGFAEDDEEAGIEASPEVQLAESWEKSSKSLQTIIAGRDKSKEPCRDIKGCMHCGTKNLQTALRNFVYIKSGWLWSSKSKVPLRLSPGDTYWRTATLTDNNDACGFVFQDAFLNYLEVQEYDEMYDWLAENTRQYLAYMGVNCRGDWGSAYHRLHYLIAFYTLAKYRHRSLAWSSWITEQIDRDTEFFISELPRRSPVWKYRSLLLCFHIVKYFSNDEKLYHEMYSELLTILERQMDFDFDSNGLCISGQMLHHDTFYPVLHQIMKFIEENQFQEERLFKKLKRKHEKITKVLSHIVNPGGLLVSLGDTPIAEKSRYLAFNKRVHGNLILRTSNLAILEDESSLSYITVGGGKNIHAVKKHSDLLSFTWQYDGKQIFYDPGRGAGEVDLYASSAIAHTAFICEDKEYLIPSYDDWTTIDSVEENESHVILNMSHRLLDGIELKRKFLWLKPNIVILIDEAESQNEESFTQNFMLEDYPVRKLDDRRVVIDIAPDFNVAITQCMAGQKFVLEEHHGTDEAENKEYLRGSLLTRGGATCKGLNLAYTQKGSMAKFFTVIECHSSSEKVIKEKKVRKLGVDKNGKLLIDYF